MLLFFKVLNFFPQLVYQTVFLLADCSGLVNLPHQFHFKLNMALILRLYLFSYFSQLFNGMAAFIQVSLATIFYAPCPIFCWDSISFLLCLSNILFFSFGISLRLPMVFCAASLIILISFLIEAYFCIYVINLGHCLTLRASFCVSLFITVFVTRLILWRLCFSELHFFLWEP